MLIGYKRSQTGVILRVKILDSSVSTGAGKTGLTSASSGLIISTIADNEAAATAYTVAGGTIESIASLGTYAAPTATKCRFKEVDATNHKGVYEIQLANARFAVANAKSLLISISGATGAADCDVVIPLRDLDPYDSVRAGLSALPNAGAGVANGLPTIDANGRTSANVTAMAANVITSTSIANNALTAAKFAAGAFDAVWTVVNRTLTAFGFNVTLAAAQPNYAPAKAGDEMNLADDAITANKLAVSATELIAETVESHLLDEGDSQMLINAIVGAIGNINVDEVALVSAIRFDLERSGGNLATIITNLATKAAQASLDALAGVATEARLSKLDGVTQIAEQADLLDAVLAASAAQAAAESVDDRVPVHSIELIPMR